MDDYRRLSLKILAWMKAEGNDFAFKCDKCTDRNKKRLNCDMKDTSEKVVFGDEEYELVTCPLNYILPSDNSFLDKYFFMQEFPHTAKSYEDTEYEFWEAYALFKSEYNKHTLRIQKDNMKKGP